MKKFLFPLFLICLGAAFSACGGGENSSSSSQSESVESSLITTSSSSESSSFESSSPEESSSVIEITKEAKNKIFVLERTNDEAQPLLTMLSSYEVSVACLEEMELIPDTIEEMVEYGQFILVNISNADMPIVGEGVPFENLLQTYVLDYGGGMLTFGGNRENENGQLVQNTYDFEDMGDSLYQDMLPVEGIQQDPALGILVIVDHYGTVGQSYRELAQSVITPALTALDERDFCSIISLQDRYLNPPTFHPMTDKQAFLQHSLDNFGTEMIEGTTFRPALEYAGKALDSLNGVGRKHIVIVTDGITSDSFKNYSKAIQDNLKKGITTSFVLFNGAGMQSIPEDIQKAAALGKGECYLANILTLTNTLKKAVTVPTVHKVNTTPFSLIIKDQEKVLTGILQEELDKITLSYCYGTKIKEEAVQPLKSVYLPFYAQWEFGEGKVGSFTTTLQDESFISFLESEVGSIFLSNVLEYLSA